MNIAILAPSPVPLAIGGAENLWWGMLEHLNRHTEHHADLIKLPTPERTFWEIIDSYRRWSELDVTGYDVVISGKYPAWMAAHPRHVCYLVHPLRGLYDTYPPHWPTREESSHSEVRALAGFLETPGPTRDHLPECFARLEALRTRSDVPDAVYGLPAPLIRQVVHFLDAIGRAPEAIARSVAMSATVARRPDYFLDPAAVQVAHPPSGLRGIHSGRGRYLFTVSRLDAPKRIELIVKAMAHVRRRVELHIAGTGAQEEHLRSLADGDSRIRLLGFLNDAQLVDAYASAIAVPFVPDREDYGYITLEAMLSSKPVITATDSGGPTELVEDGVTGFIVAPEPAALGEAMDQLASRRRLARRLGATGASRARLVTWQAVVDAMLNDLA